MEESSIQVGIFSSEGFNKHLEDSGDREFVLETLKSGCEAGAENPPFIFLTAQGSSLWSSSRHLPNSSTIPARRIYSGSR